MSHDITKNMVEQLLKAATDIVRSSDDQPDAHAELDPVEKALLGLAPDDPIRLTPGPVIFGPDTLAIRLQVVRNFLAEQPEIRETLAQEVEEAWGRAGGQRQTFLVLMAERRAQILSRAELSHMQREAPKAVTDFVGELSRYLTEMEGFSASGSIE